MTSRPQIFPVYICWDLNACPPPEDKHPFNICRTIYKAARRQNMYGDAQIRMYYTKEAQLPGLTAAKVHDYRKAGCVITSADNEFEKVNAMLVDILLWAINVGKPANYLVITKIQQDTEYLIRGLLSVKERGPDNVFLILPDMTVPSGLSGITSYQFRKDGAILTLTDAEPDTGEITIWACNLLESVLEEDEDSDTGFDHGLDDEEEEEEEDAEEEQEDEKLGEARLSQLWRPTFFSTRAINCKETNTSVLWDVEDYPLPPNLTLYALYENIKHYMKEKAASNGDVIIWAYVPDSMMEAYKTLADEFGSYEFDGVPANRRFIFVPKVQQDKCARLHQMTVDVLLWALDNPLYDVPNLLVISKNMEEAKAFFCLMLGGLATRGWPIFLTLPAADDVPPKYTKEEHVVILPWDDLLSREDSNKRKNLSPPGYPDKRKNVAD